MNVLRLLHALLGILLLTPFLNGAEDNATETSPELKQLKAGQAALRTKEYDAAVALLDKVIALDGNRTDEAAYLKALALYHGKKYEACAAACSELVARHAKSVWRHKASFLAAAAHVGNRDYEKAEAIYEKEANRLLSAARKQDVAGVIIHFADELATVPGKDDLKASPPNFNKAYSLYGRALSMEIGRDLRDEVTFKKARAIHRANNSGQAINDYRAYLNEFDPDWMGQVGSPRRAAGMKKEKPAPAGKFPLEARFHLAEAQLLAQRMNEARVNAEDLLQLVADKNLVDEKGTLVADSHWLLVKTYRMPAPGRNELERALKAARDFIEAHPRDPRAVYAAWWIPQAYRHVGRADDAIAAYEDFIAKKHHGLPEGEALTASIPGLEGNPAKQQSDWEKAALYQIAKIRYGQKKYEEATKAWESYVNKYPDGPDWSACQRGIIDARHQIAMDAVEAEDYPKARKLFEEFLAANPLDSRAGRILFLFGQIAYEDALELERQAKADDDRPDDEKPDEEDVKAAFEEAIGLWKRVVSKYRNTEEASLALYRIALIHEEKFGDWKTALETYRQITWGSKAANARTRVGLMTKVHLGVQTDKTFHSDETPVVRLTTRNVKKVTVKQYFLDLEAYFRKTHAIGNVDHLDVALIQPDKSWEVEVEDYDDYRPIEQTIEVPYDEGRVGACLLNVSDDNFEATTIVIRSDLALVLKSSRREALAFVENRRLGKPAAEVKVLLSDGKKVFGSGLTEEDGVFRQKFDELKSVETLRVFAIADGHVASNLVGLQGLSFNSGLAPKGYLYTDRPAYQPGETVKLRGVIRDVKDGSYVVPEGKAYLVSVTDSSGRLIRESEEKPSKFGTFHLSFKLDDLAQPGTYALAAREKDDPTRSYASSFLVQRFQLEKVRLKLETDREVYFRGETIELSFLAEYYWGQPAAGKQITYVLPDGRSLVGHTDDEGKLEVKYDTTGNRPGTALGFRATVDGENARGALNVFLAREGFYATVKPSRPLVLSGEPFDVTVKTEAPDGEPVGKDLTLYVLRRQTAKPNPVLRFLPWHGGGAQRIEETTVQEHKLSTDPESGEGSVSIKLKEGGEYVLRVAGEDRFKQTVSAENRVKISDEEDATKLRFFSKSDVVQVGASAKLRLHSRLDDQLALLTFEGEEIIEHRVVTLKKGFNPVPLKVGHEHFPNFNVCVNAMDDQSLRFAVKAFSVERQLNVNVTPKRDTYEPGAEAEVELLVTDQLGKPVEAELSLSLVDEALYALFPDRSPHLRTFFQQDALRFAEFRIGSSVGFRYVATTRKVVKEFLDEKARLERRKEEEKNLARAANQLRDRQLAMSRSEFMREAAESGQAENAQQLLQATGGLALPGQGAEPQSGGRRILQGFLNAPAANAPTADFLQRQQDGQSLGRANALGPNQSLQVGGFGKNTFFSANLDDFDASGGEADKSISGADAATRREIAGAGHWLPAIVTDAKGKATVTFSLPSSTGEWRLSSKGVTAETLVGQTVSKLVTRKDFFLSMKTPAQLQEGDSIRLLARLHNLSDFEGEAKLTLRLLGGEKFEQVLAERQTTAAITKQGVAELTFDSVEIPSAANLRMQVSASAGDDLSDVLSRTFPVRPWGMEFADHDGGSSTGDAKAILSIPADRRDGSQWMTITIGPGLKQGIVDMALGHAATPWAEGGQNRKDWLLPPPRIGGFPGSDLLAVVSALEFARKVDAGAAELARLERRALTLIGSLVTSQRDDGGWTWRSRSHASHWGVTSASFRALCAARDAKLPVHAQTIEKAKNYLRSSFTRFSANANDAKAIVLHALSADGAAEFAHANRLHRERNTLTPPALAHLTLAFMNLDRREFASELLDLLAAKLVQTERNGKTLRHCPGVNSNSWTSEDTETTALAALAFMRTRPGAEQIKPLVEYLLSRRGAYGFTAAKARGPAIAALAHFYGEGQFAKDDYELTVLVNGKELRTLKVKGAARATSLAVPRDMLAEEENVVDFRLNGRGQYVYAVTLRRFSKNLKDPKSWQYPYPQYRRYYHAPLLYRGKSIGVHSSTQVKNIEIGQRVRAYVDTYYYSTSRDFRGYLVVEEYVPAGMMLDEATLSGNHKFHQVDGNKITMYFPPGQTAHDFSYELIGYAPGVYKALPTVMRDAVNPSRMRTGPATTLTVLDPGEKSPDPYAMSNAERYKLGQLMFNDGNYDEALEHLAHLRKHDPRHNEQTICRMLLWIYTSPGRYDANRIIEVFEVLRERYPTLEIPFDKILVVGRAYRDLGEFERAYLVFKATIDASFINEVNVSAILEDEGLFLGSIDYQEDLWREYPDTAEVSNMYFSISQALYLKAPKAHELAREREVAILRGGKPVRQGRRKPEKIAMLRETIRLLNSFLTLHPENPLADDAAFSMANALLDLKMHNLVIDLCDRYKKRFPESEFSGGYQYMTALAHFWKHDHAEALQAAAIVAEQDGKDKNFAQYIIGQIHHAQGAPAQAIEWYQKVKEQYPDAKQAIDYFEQKHVKLDEVNVFRPGEKVELTLKYRNVKDAFLQVYRVDLMKLYLREKNLSKITQVSLAGIAPLLESTLPLGDGKDYVDKEKTAPLELKEDGAYLVICRGDDLFASSLVLVTPLKIEVQEDVASGRVRANVRDVSADKYVAGVHVKAIGSMDAAFKSGETDLRGIYVADALRGSATVIARDEENNYAFYRGKTHLGAPANNNRAPQPPPAKNAKPYYRGNLDVQNKLIQKGNWGGYDTFRRATNKGVQIQQVR